MNAANEIIHQTMRLKIMSALNALPDREMLEFVRLKALSGATEGNLGAHIGSLEQAGYIEVIKDFHNNRPRTRAKLTRAGRRAFEDYIAFLKSIIGES